MALQRVLTAQPYSFGSLGSFGKGEYVLLQQVNFPDTYDADLDHKTAADHDRIRMWDSEHWEAVCRKHLGKPGALGLGGGARTASKKALMALCKDAHKAGDTVALPDGTEAPWTGCRVTGTVNRSNGYAVWTIELFAKHPDSKTKVYSTARAPNVSRKGWRGTSTADESPEVYMDGSMFYVEGVEEDMEDIDP